jgi:Protein of unknown function (DUF3592)
MVGLDIDVVIAFLIKVMLRLWRARGSGSWKAVRAQIDSCRFDDSWAANCPTVHIGYTYEYEGKTYSGRDSKPYLSSRFAEEYAERFREGETAMVRVNPQHPEKSVLR